MDEIAVRVIICGRVQGVGYRYDALRQASALGLSGWVRNRADGSVEVLAEGPARAVERFLERMRQGPPGARVTSLDEARLEPGSGGPGFRILADD
jgi:acylphosphatase